VCNTAEPTRKPIARVGAAGGAAALSRTAKAATGERQHNSLAVNALQNGLFHVAKQAILHGETTCFAMLND
jgi:hypothetical protein